jgi:hypothetical protein
MRWMGHVANTREKRNLHKYLVGKSKERTRDRWEENIETDLRKIGWDSLN